jgi:hypothetical protein
MNPVLSVLHFLLSDHASRVRGFDPVSADQAEAHKEELKGLLAEYEAERFHEPAKSETAA